MSVASKAMSYEPPPGCSREKARVLRAAYDYVIPGRVLSFHELGVDLVMGKREGYRFWDLDGQEFMDFHLNGGVFTLGHRNPELVALLRESLETLDIGNHHFPSSARASLAELIVRLSPPNLRYAVFSSGGSEANDVAIKSARYATKRRKIVSLDNAYHGRTGLAGAAGADAAAIYFKSENPDFIRVPSGDLDAMEQALRREDVAGVMIETIPAAAGFVPFADDYLPGVRALCTRYGSLYICDEVQSGLGRSGKLWAISLWNVEPDILVTAKGLTGGLYPIAATVLSSRAGAWLADNGWGHVSTGGGGEVGCGVAQRVLEICSDPNNLALVLETSEYLAAGLWDIQQRHPFLRAVHRRGLVMGLEFDNPRGGVDMMKALYDRGLWAIFAGFNSSILQFKAGTFVDRGYCDTALQRVEDAIRVAARRPKGNAIRIVAGGRSEGGSL